MSLLRTTRDRFHNCELNQREVMDDFRSKPVVC